MKWVLNTKWQETLDIIESRCEYFLEYTRDIVLQVLSWDMNLWEMYRQVSYIRDIAKRDSLKNDEQYELWRFWRLWIIQWGPDNFWTFCDEYNSCAIILNSYLNQKVD